MNVVFDEVKELVQKEYAAAVKNHGPLASLHEAYAVLAEEMEEAADALRGALNQSNGLWICVKHDELEQAERIANVIMRRAIDTACESIQIAAVAKRIFDLNGQKKE